ncbi:MAG: tRNA (guanosine(37)-N1)-methyltransferase TrmD [Candidatus Krumholzibacteria bacterium]|nr:tRNA (guanosine(37)-N1)-methyltransferase TrmD [Candidatus Krumholzibacteria bacterium]
MSSGADQQDKAAEVPCIKILTLFPDMVRTVLETSIPGRAERQGQVRYEVVDIREFSVDKHRTVDDTAYGGGAGMIMMAKPVVEAVESVRQNDDTTVILTTPQGETFDEALTMELLADLQLKGELILICGHYKGIDERAIELVVNREVSIGDYVLSGGVLPALVVADALVRRIEGVLHNEDSANNDSFTTVRGGGLDWQWYTKPPEYRGLTVPEVLLSGHHGKIKEWRDEQAKNRTEDRRPDLTSTDDESQKR